MEKKPLGREELEKVTGGYTVEYLYSFECGEAFTNGMIVYTVINTERDRRRNDRIQVRTNSVTELEMRREQSKDDLWQTIRPEPINMTREIYVWELIEMTPYTF